MYKNLYCNGISYYLFKKKHTLLKIDYKETLKSTSYVESFWTKENVEPSHIIYIIFIFITHLGIY